MRIGRDRFQNSMLYVVLFVSMSVLSLPRAMAVALRHDKDITEAERIGVPFEAAGRVLPEGGCTLIAPTWVITAAHVATSLPTGAYVQFGERKFLVKRSIIHPEGIAPRGQPPEVDLALLELAEPVTGIMQVELNRAREEAGQTLYIVGYGDFGDPLSGFRHTDGKRRAVTNVVADVGPRRIFMVFNKPPKGTNFEGVGGPGDSGGPTLLARRGSVFLVGVSSASMNGRPGQHGVTDVYTRVSSYADWIDQAMGRSN